jgi:hypothetical protein
MFFALSSYIVASASASRLSTLARRNGMQAQKAGSLIDRLRWFERDFLSKMRITAVSSGRPPALARTIHGFRDARPKETPGVADQVLSKLLIPVSSSE